MTAQAPTDAELLKWCDEIIENCRHQSAADARIVARALRSRLSPQTLQENTPHATAVPIPACPSTLRTSGEQPPLSPVGPHLGPEWLEEIQKRHDEFNMDDGLPQAKLLIEFTRLLQDRATLLAHIRKATPGWRGIESAPKDGTELLLVTGFIFVGRWFEPGFGTEGWWTVNAMPVHPTHWMPLPKPPSAEG